MTTNPLFPDQETIPTIDPNKDYASELIGEDKRFKTAADLARAKVESDAFIERLKAENAQMRASLKGEQKMDEFFDKLKSFQPQNTGTASTQNTNSGEDATTQNSQNTSTQGLSIAQVQELMEKRERERTEESNLSFAVSKVKEAFGANYAETLKQKASELGLTPEDALTLARTKPQAFLKLVEADKVSSPSPQAPRSQVNTAAFKTPSNGGEKTQAYYQALRKQIGDAEFFKPKIQNELHKDAMRLGEAFFK